MEMKIVHQLFSFLENQRYRWKNDGNDVRLILRGSEINKFGEKESEFCIRTLFRISFF